MGIYSKYLNPVEQGAHGLFESSRVKSTDIGRLFDAIVRDGNEEDSNPIDVDNGMALRIHEFTGDGLQTVYATIAQKGDKIAVVGAPPIVKTAFTQAQASILNFYIPAGKPAKAYEIVDEDYEIFAVGKHQFTNADDADIKFGAYVVVDGTGKWTAQEAEPAKGEYGFIGKIHSLAFSAEEFAIPVVRIQCIQNKQVG